MKIIELEGIVDAIEVESQSPSPSHQNLARLTARFFRGLIQNLEAPTPEVDKTPIVTPPPAVEPEAVIPHKGRKSKGK